MKVAVSKFARTLSTRCAAAVWRSCGPGDRFQNLRATRGLRGSSQISWGPWTRAKVSRGRSIKRDISLNGRSHDRIGEEDGELEENAHEELRTFYDTQVDTAYRHHIPIEPLLIGFLGIVIGGIVVALFLADLTLSQAIK